MNLGEAKQKAISIMAEYSVDGVIVSAGENADYLNRMNRFADAAQHEIAQVKKIHYVYHLTNNPIKPQQGLLSGFELKQYLPGSDVIDQYPGSKAYYFEVDNVADVYIEELINGNWVQLQVIHNENKGVFTKYKGLILANNPADQIRLRFSGQYVYNYRNKALFAYSFPTADDIPDYAPWVRYDMPTDFMDIQKVIFQSDTRQYKEMIDYYWEGKRTFVLNYYNSGSIDIHYYKYPEPITVGTDDSYEFEVDQEAQEAIPFYLAGHALMDEDAQRSVQFLNEYQVRLSRLFTSDDFGIQAITQTYSM